MYAMIRKRPQIIKAHNNILYKLNICKTDKIKRLSKNKFE